MPLLSPRLTLVALATALVPVSLFASTPLPPAAIAHELQRFRSLGTVLHIAAHPDDENTELITYLSRSRGYRTAYLSLTRGDGGQNELGRDFDEKLGVLRTQELLAARRLDGGQQFFTRAIDFGYSKSADETLTLWDRREVLSDVVRIIRQFRPDVIVTRFPIPPGSGGHGHHTASGIIAVEAFHLAGDPTAYPEQLAQGLSIWQPRRVLWNSFRIGSTTALNGTIIKRDISGNDPVTGEALGSIAGRSRAMHKTQSLGGFASRANLGPNVQSFMLLAGDELTDDLMDGIDTTWARVAGGAEIDALVSDVLANFSAAQPAASVPALLEIHNRMAALPSNSLFAAKRAQLALIIQSCLGLQIETSVAQAEAVPGESLQLNYTVRSAPGSVDLRYHGLRAPAFGYTEDRAAARMAEGDVVTGSASIVLPSETSVTQPYWLRAEGAAGIARVDDISLIGRPENPPTLPVAHHFSVNGFTFILPSEALHRTIEAESASAVPLAVIPPLSLGFDAETYVFAPSAQKSVAVTVTAARAVADGELHLDLPAGWRAEPAMQPLPALTAGATAVLTFNVIASAAPSAGHLAARATIGGHTYSTQRQELRYAHLPPQLLQPAARARVASFAVENRALHIGYLPGAGDAVANGLEQIGATVRVLSAAELTPEGLAGLDAVVIGVRAFNEREDLAAALPGLFDWVETGGTVIAQYNRPNRLRATTLAPYALSLEGSAPQWRVTDENSPFTFLLPDHPALTTPNQLGPDDFAGWVQERGAYFPSSWDETQFVAPLAFNDPGETPLRSSVLIARHGRGHYVYTSLALFRQIPAGVPGAYRLLANLVSLGK
ncbi:MAG: PIG-L family deacetylase [Candidatus Didemnitutus sp.]|nr:PIG-L family deacetylase [Candidatus Didemnitutus sp.]